MIRMRAASRSADPEIVIVDIDDRSLAVMADDVGRFPWPRSVYGEVLTELDRQGARAVVMDVELYEPDAVRPEQDQFLNEVLAGSTNTFFPIRLLERIDAEEGVRIADFAELLDLPAVAGRESERAGSDAASLRARPAGVGAHGTRQLPGGRGRRRPALLAAARRRRLAHSVVPARIATALGYPLPEGESFRLDWFGGVAPHEQISFSDFYQDLRAGSAPATADEFRGDIVVIGSSSNHLRDFRTTPVASLFAGRRDPRHRDRQPEERRAPHRSAARRRLRAPAAARRAALRRAAAALESIAVLALLVAATVAFLGGS